MVASNEITIDDLAEDFHKYDSANTSTPQWEVLLKKAALHALQQGDQRIMDITTPLYEKAMITAALQHTKGRKKEAAERLGLGRNTLTRKITDLKIDT